MKGNFPVKNPLRQLANIIQHNTFASMPNQIPLKNLIVLNWIISLMASVLGLIYSFGISFDIWNAFTRLLQIFIFMSMVSFYNLGLLIIFPECRQTGDKYAKIKFYLSSYLATVLSWFLVKISYSVLTGRKWEGDGKHIYTAYILAILTIWILNTLVIFLHNLVILHHKKTQGEIENLQLKANLSETENLLLRQQIHPHFLFNALNTVKSLYKKNSQQGEDYLVHLANFLRVAISNHSTKTTLMKNELEFCLDYLKMQKIRFGTALDYVITISEEAAHAKYLPYFSLQPLVENSLKHNDLTEERPIMITIKETDGYVYVSNNLQPRSYRAFSTGQGLSNLAERYRLLGEKEIMITSDSSFFTVRIKILNQ